MANFPDTRPIRRQRSWRLGVGRCLRRRCPDCGQGKLFYGFLTLALRCPHCGHDHGRYRADDGPAYFTIFAVGHVIVPALLLVERLWQPPLWLHALAWTFLGVLLSLVFLPLFKAIVVGVQWALDLAVDERF